MVLLKIFGFLLRGVKSDLASSCFQCTGRSPHQCRLSQWSPLVPRRVCTNPLSPCCPMLLAPTPGRRGLIPVNWFQWMEGATVSQGWNHQRSLKVQQFQVESPFSLTLFSSFFPLLQDCVQLCLVWEAEAKQRGWQPLNELLYKESDVDERYVKCHEIEAI